MQITESQIKAALDGTFRRIVFTAEGQQFETVKMPDDHIPLHQRTHNRRSVPMYQGRKQPAFGRRFGL